MDIVTLAIAKNSASEDIDKVDQKATQALEEAAKVDLKATEALTEVELVDQKATQTGNVVSGIVSKFPQTDVYATGSGLILGSNGELVLDDKGESYPLVLHILEDIYSTLFETMGIELPAKTDSLKAADIKEVLEAAYGQEFDPEGQYGDNLIFYGSDVGSYSKNLVIKLLDDNFDEVPDRTSAEYVWQNPIMENVNIGIKHLTSQTNLDLNRSTRWVSNYTLDYNYNTETNLLLKEEQTSNVFLSQLPYYDIVTSICIFNGVEPTEQTKERIRQTFSIDDDDGIGFIGEQDILLLVYKDISLLGIQKGISSLFSFNVSVDEGQETMHPVKINGVPEFKLYFQSSGNGETYTDGESVAF